ncbi:potassium channel family protein [Clostridium ljungdahlii]|uniref:Ion channel n=1 Tax=Clostridium ljungdahlii TaxID=1538 RepID=A0A168MH55_9CLOT|nr:potassium channel family protein [Clostridium ljungdahlii]OAA84683.1 Ion channel [Clostridium ljungdahlii]
MNESSYLSLIPILIILLIAIMPIVMYVFIKKVKIFRKALFSYFITAILLIAVFAIIYILVFVIDLQNFKQKYPNGFNGMNISSCEKKEIVNSFLHIKGINISDYNGNFALFFLDLLYFSSMTFFTIGYGDVTVSGIVRIFPIIEGFLGVALTGIIISMILSNLSEMSKKEDMLRMFIFKGYDILFFEKISIEGFHFLEIFSKYLAKIKSKRDNKDMYNIHLMNSNGKITTIFGVRLNYELKEMYEKFRLEWDFVDYRNKNVEYYYKFVQYLRYVLMNKLDLELEVEFHKFVGTRKEINLLQFKQFLIKLREYLINDRMKDIDIGLNNEIVELTTKCIYGIDEISEEK